MDQPWWWSTLLAVVVVAGALRLWAGRALVPRRASPVPAAPLVVAVCSAVALGFHCAAMFFAPWVTLLPGATGPAAAINAMGAASELAYWAPAALLPVALWRVWWPALLGLGVCLAGVGITMFWPYQLATHLSWLTALILVGAVVFTGFIGQRTPSRGARQTDHPAHA